MELPVPPACILSDLTETWDFLNPISQALCQVWAPPLQLWSVTAAAPEGTQSKLVTFRFS